MRIQVAGATQVGSPALRTLKCKFSSQPQIGGYGAACEGNVTHALMVGGSPAAADLLIGLPMECIHELDPFSLSNQQLRLPARSRTQESSSRALAAYIAQKPFYKRDMPLATGTVLS